MNCVKYIEGALESQNEWSEVAHYFSMIFQCQHRVKIEVERCSERMIQEFLELMMPIVFSQPNVI